MKTSTQIPYEQFTGMLSETEKNLFSLFLRLKREPYEEKANIKVLQDHWGYRYPAAKIYRGENVKGIQSDKEFPGRKKYLGYLKTEEAIRTLAEIHSRSRTYQEVFAAGEKRCVSKGLANEFLSVKDMMAEDHDNGIEITSLSRYRKRNGISPFERERKKTAQEKAIKNLNYGSYLDEILNENISCFEQDIERMLSEEDFILTLRYSNYYQKEGGYSEYPPHFTKKELRRELADVRDEFFDMALMVPISRGNYKFKTNLWFRDCLDERVEGLREYSHRRDEFGEQIMKACTLAAENLFCRLKERFPKERIKELIAANEICCKELERYETTLKNDEEKKKNVLRRIPEHYRDSYPDARGMHRKFVLHIGPTNSGKTHDAVETLKTAEHGIYLAPLRLLAFEQFETLNEAGVPCSMVTGEERILTEGAVIQSSTIEMLQMKQVFDIAVIDEAQMIADKDRGGAWSAAMYGVRANEIHVCAAPEAEDILKRIVEDCGDEYSVVYHKRLADLEYEEKKFRFPQDVQPGDALICFSRKHVHAVAAELAEAGIKASILYGDLPYDVRHREAERFSRGETSVVVATDVIGMGMNLPIRRVVFLETRKFDGTGIRKLNASEIRQIAGRAGRYRIYPKGIVSSCETTIIKEGLNTVIPPIRKVRISFPEQLAEVPGKLSASMKIWRELPDGEIHEKADITALETLTKWCEKHSRRKDVIIRFVKIPFDIDNAVLRRIWNELFLKYIKGEPAEIDRYIREICDPESRNMENLEFQYRCLDLLYNYCFRFQEEYCEHIMNLKLSVSEKILGLLKEQMYSRRTCRYCGRRLRWNEPYSICQRCYRERSSGRYFDIYD